MLSATASRSARGSISSIGKRIERPGEVGGEAQTLGRALAAGAHDRGQAQQALGRVDRRRHRLASIDRVERAADPFLELRIADRDQPRQQ